MFRCRVCHFETSESTVLNVPEMMIGTRKEFEYLHCSSCGSLSLVGIPENLGWYYGQNYYSHQFVTGLFTVGRKVIESQFVV